jgi:hypothetical protein
MSAGTREVATTSARPNGWITWSSGMPHPNSRGGGMPAMPYRAPIPTHVILLLITIVLCCLLINNYSPLALIQQLSLTNTRKTHLSWLGANLKICMFSLSSKIPGWACTFSTWSPRRIASHHEPNRLDGGTQAAQGQTQHRSALPHPAAPHPRKHGCATPDEE